MDYYLLYKPVLDGTFKSVQDDVKNNEELLLDFLIQIIESINIYRKLGFIHTDVNITNIMFKKMGDIRYQWYWIDYGNITNNKYPDSLLDIERKEEQPYYKFLEQGQKHKLLHTVHFLLLRIHHFLQQCFRLNNIYIFEKKL